MIGLIKKDYLAYRRTSSLWSELLSYLIITGGVCLWGRNMYTLALSTLLALPASMIGPPTTLKHIDVECSGGRYSMALPYSWKDVVRSRFFTGAAVELQEIAISLGFALFHWIAADIPLTVCLGMWATGILLMTVFLSVGTMVSFLAGENLVALFYMVVLALSIGVFVLNYTVWGFDMETILRLSAVIPLPVLWCGAAVLTGSVCWICYRVSLWVWRKQRRGTWRRRTAFADERR